MVGSNIRRLLGIGGSQPPRYRIRVITGDRRNAGTDANVYVVLTDERGQNSKDLHLNLPLRDDHERGETTVIDVGIDAGVEGAIQRLEVWRDNALNIPYAGRFRGYLLQKDTHPRDSGAWFLDRIEVECVSDSICWVFPVHRWIKPDKRYKVELYDCLLPQDDPNIEDRRQELREKKEMYQYDQKVVDGPMQIKELPTDDTFSEKYLISTIITVKHWLQLKGKFLSWLGPDLKIMEDYRETAKAVNMLPTEDIFTEKHHPMMTYAKVVIKGIWDNIWVKAPDNSDTLEAATVWKQDEWFGAQRLQGVNPVVIKLCTEIPDKLGVTADLVENLLGGMTLNDALNNKKIFICDLEIMKDLKIKEGNEVGAPIALFYLTPENILLPIAIQLKQDKASDNPVYTPLDPSNTWLVAKMYYNNAEAQHHQALTHLGLTHLLMEGIVIATKRHLSPSHPLYKLMAPHFLYLLAINSRGLSTLLAPGGWVDRTMTQGVEGIFNLIKRGFQEWRFDHNGNVEIDLKMRGVLDEDILPNYPYREEALELHNVIKKYVETVVYQHYSDDQTVCADEEIQNWRLELARGHSDGGVGLQGLPGGDANGFARIEEVIEMVTFVISTCSLGHAAANFQQFSQYSFIPNYPGLINGSLPKEKKEYTTEDIRSLLPDKSTSLDIMVITRLLSIGDTRSLGDFDVPYLYTPQGLKAVQEFQEELSVLSTAMEERNKSRKWKYEWLDPKIVPNSISI